MEMGVGLPVLALTPQPPLPKNGRRGVKSYRQSLHLLAIASNTLLKEFSTS